MLFFRKPTDFTAPQRSVSMRCSAQSLLQGTQNHTDDGDVEQRLYNAGHWHHDVLLTLLINN